jgi:nucleoside-diphosphate-sugar epimerase
MRIILTGASGFVGEGILLECLQNPQVIAILMVNRKPVDRSHPKLKELIVPDFFRLNDFADELRHYDACFYAAGISSVGMNEEKYTLITYDTLLWPLQKRCWR